MALGAGIEWTETTWKFGLVAKHFAAGELDHALDRAAGEQALEALALVWRSPPQLCPGVWRRTHLQAGRRLPPASAVRTLQKSPGGNEGHVANRGE